jgi:hypothetical protein
MILFDSDYTNIADIVNRGKIAEEEARHERLLGLSVLPQ